MQRVTVRLTGTYGYVDPDVGRREYFGPGESVSVPVGLARALGFDVESQLTKPTPEVPAEPEQTATVQDPPQEPATDTIPEDFPHAEVLAENGITALSEVPTDEEGLTALEGIGAKRAAEILQALKG